MSSVASILSGKPAGLAEVARVGTAVIANAAKIVTVSDAKVTTNSYIIVWGVGAADTTALTFSVDNLLTGSFQIGTNAAVSAVGGKTVGYAILKY